MCKHLKNLPCHSLSLPVCGSLCVSQLASTSPYLSQIKTYWPQTFRIWSLGLKISQGSFRYPKKSGISLGSLKDISNIQRFLRYFFTILSFRNILYISDIFWYSLQIFQRYPRDILRYLRDHSDLYSNLIGVMQIFYMISHVHI